MGDDDRGTARCQHAKPLEPVPFTPGVHHACGFIEDDNLSFSQKGPSRRQALPFARTEFRSVSEPLAQNSVVTSRKARNQFFRARGTCCSLDTLHIVTVCMTSEFYILPDSHLVIHRHLEHDRDSASQFCKGELSEV